MFFLLLSMKKKQQQNTAERTNKDVESTNKDEQSLHPRLLNTDDPKVLMG